MTTDPVHIGADAGDQQLTATLQNLDPNSNYHFEVIATNSIDTTTQSGQDFATDRQIGGIARLPIELDDSGQSQLRLPGDRANRLGRRQRACNTWCPTVCSQATKRTQPSTR